MRCTACGGTILPPARAGAPRGSCHCWRGGGRVSGTRYNEGPAQPVVYRYTVHFPTFHSNAVDDGASLEDAMRRLLALRTEYFLVHNIPTWPGLPAALQNAEVFLALPRTTN
jgi:hypothetical protein